MQALAAWQWELYPKGHTTRRNLTLHIVSSPLFLVGTGAAIGGAIGRSAPVALVGAVLLVGGLIAQGRGHKTEPVPPVPFSSPWNFVARFLLEQYFTFPRFVLTGGFARAWRASKAGATASPALE